MQRAITYHGLVFAPDANGGPGVPKFELDADWLNVVWQQTLNQSSQAAFTLLRTCPLIPLIDWNVDHCHIWRESVKGTVPVFTGKLWKPQYGPRDVVVWMNDYAAYLAKSRSGWMTDYGTKLIGSEIVAPEWAAAKALDHSPFAFVATGTIENPLGVDGITAIKTNSEFGTAMQTRLMLFYTLAELAMANTANNVVWEITRTAPYTFNFWRNRGVARSDWQAIVPGNLVSYEGDVVGGIETNDVATPLDDGVGGSSIYVLDDAATVATYRRLQDAVSISTLVGLTAATTETDQTKAALARILATDLRRAQLVAEYPAQGDLDPFLGWDLGDLHSSHYERGDHSGDLFAGPLRDISVAGAWVADRGEQLVIYRRTP